MNGTVESTHFVSKRSTSPRPPTVGEEVKKFHDSSYQCSDPSKNDLQNMEEHRKSPCGSGEVPNRPTTPTCSESVSESTDCTENSNLSPPPPFKWAQSLSCLLEDELGCSLFTQFLIQEGQDTRCLEFWFACNGIKKQLQKPETLFKLVNVIYEKKVKFISAISSETKEEIRQKLASRNGVDDKIFDVAHREVEEYMMRTTYPNFLHSDIYIQQLGKYQNKSLKEEVVSPEATDLLPTVHEDSELKISSKKLPLIKENILRRSRIAATSRSEGHAGLYLKSPYANNGYYAKYAPYLPASAQDSELQSLSSDAQTDDNMSMTDSSVDYSMYSRSKQKRQHNAAKHNVVLNKETVKPAFIPRTQRLPDTMRTLPPKEFHALLVQKLMKVIDSQKTGEKISEKLKIIEGSECSKTEVNRISDQRNQKTVSAPVFDTSFFGPTEDNVQDILDKHVSRVFNDSGQQTPLSPLCISPPVGRQTSEVPERTRVPMHGVCAYESSQEFSYTPAHKTCSPFTVPYSIRLKKDPDTGSIDSGAMVNFTSNENLSISHKSQFSSSCNTEFEYYQNRRTRDQAKRYNSKKLSSMTDASSLVDSGISLACESVPPSTKVCHWLESKRCTSETDKEHFCKNSCSSPVFSGSSSSKRVVMYNSSRPGTLDCGSTPWPLVSLQSIPQDMLTPTLSSPDTTSNLLEAKRRLEDESRTKNKLKYTSNSRSSHDASRMKMSKAYDSFDDGYYYRKQSRKSCPGAMLDGSSASTSNEVTVIGYSYGRHSVPYLSKLPGKNITLRQFKSLLSKKGNFRYFFKKASDDFGTGVVFEEIYEDYEILPLWEGKVFCVIESMDDNL